MLVDMKVLFLIHTLGGGGAEKVLVNLANNLDKSKYDVTVMTVINTGINRENIAPHIKYKTILNIPFKKKNHSKSTELKSGSLLSGGGFIKKILASGYSFLWKIIPTRILYKIFIREKYDFEVAFLEGISAKIISSSNNKDSKKIGWIHVDLLNERKSEKFFLNANQEKRCYKNFNQIVCVSNNVSEAFIEKFNFAKSKVLVKYNPLDVADIIGKAQDDVEIDKPKKFLMGTIGRLIHQKGYDRLLRIAKRLADEKYDFELWIIGDGLERDKLEKYIVNTQLEDYVKLLGFRDNPYKYLKLADLFVCSSYAEGFSTVASEAVILGVPIVTVDCSGMKELLGYNNEYGIVTENSEEALHEGLTVILNDEKKYLHYKEKVLKRSSFFNISETVKEIESLLHLQL